MRPPRLCRCVGLEGSRDGAVGPREDAHARCPCKRLVPLRQGEDAGRRLSCQSGSDAVHAPQEGLALVVAKTENGAALRCSSLSTSTQAMHSGSSLPLRKCDP